MAKDFIFIKTNPPVWRGNGFGTAPALYVVHYKGKPVGKLDCLQYGEDWFFLPSCDDPIIPRFRERYFVDIKKEVVRRIENALGEEGH